MAAWRRRRDEDFSDEVQAHLELEADRLIEDGMAPEAARAAARKAFGNATRARERFHERSRWAWLDQARQDLRYAARGLRASPAFVATTVITLAVGLGLITVAFTIFNAYVLRPFAVLDPSRLYRVAWRAPAAVGHDVSWRGYDELRARTDLFDAVIGSDMRFVKSDGRVLVAAFVSPNYFTVLQPRTRAGRTLGPGDANLPVAVLGEQAWSRLFAADPNVLGRTIDLGAGPVTIVGVLREEFGGLDEFPRDVWLPTDRADGRPTIPVVRLRAGVTPDAAEAALADFALRAAPPGTAASDVHAVLVPAATANPLSIEMIAALSPVFAAFALVLMTACFNVSNVMLSRAVARQREIAVRLSLGASRSRIVRQLVTEGLLIAALAALAGVALAAWLLRTATALLFSTLPPTLASLLRVARMPVDYRVFLFASAAAAVTTLLFALVPALQASRQRLTDVLHGQRSGRHAASRTRNALVIAQVAVSLVLVVTALVLARNFMALGTLDLGYSTANVYSINVRGETKGRIAPLARALAADPGIATVAVTDGNPLFGPRRVPAAPGNAAAVPTPYTFVSPEFLPMIQLAVVRGRAFRGDEAASGAPVAIVSESTARTFWPGADPLGRTIRIDRPPPGRLDAIDGYTQVTVIGTVRDIVSGLIVEGRDSGHIYLPMTEDNPHASALLATPRGQFHAEPVREAARRLGQDPDTIEMMPLDEMRETQTYPLRAAAWVGGLLGGIALVLSVSGLYGVLVYTLAQRRREIGIRMALGATAGAVVGLVMRQSARMTGVGLAIGLAVAFALLEALASVIELRAVSVLDPVAFAAGAVAVAACAAAAAYFPSRRAARIDPAETLRAEA